MKNSAVFRTELSYIKDDVLRDAVIEVLEYCVPDYFYRIPASSSGKHHPAYALGEGGLVRHTKAAVKIACDLLSLEQYGTLCKYSDEIIAALILHDSFKCGYFEGTTEFFHPLIAAEAIANWVTTHYSFGPLWYEFDCIGEFIKTHMGQWNTRCKEELPKPETPEQKFVHLCDYLASRKYITVEVE